MGRIRGNGLCVILNHKRFCGSAVMSRFYGLENRDPMWCCTRLEDKMLLTMFNSIVRDEVNRNKFQEDSAILNSSFMDNLI